MRPLSTVPIAVDIEKGKVVTVVHRSPVSNLPHVGDPKIVNERAMKGPRRPESDPRTIEKPC